MAPIFFINTITILGVFYMLMSNLKLFKKIKLKQAKISPNSNDIHHLQQHISFSVLIFIAGILSLFGIINGNNTLSGIEVLNSGMILNSLINTLPYVILGFVCDHFSKR